jgi:hypothetical protein
MRTTISLVTLLSVSSSAQAPTVDQLLDRMAAYLKQYEEQLSSVVADERFQQRVVYTRAYRGGLPVTSDERRRLDSEIGFLRLPGGADWLGFRDVRKINGKDVPPTAQRRVADTLAATSDSMLQARAIAQGSAEHNLGVPRTTNVPTAALEIIHPRNFAAHKFERRGDDSIRRTKLAVIGFTEQRRPPLVNSGGQELVSSGKIWLEPSSGTIWRVEWTYAPAIGSPSSLRVDFAMDDALGMMVPVEMHENFFVIGGLNARGDGVAFYSNFRRFGTGGRIVPQQP